MSIEKECHDAILSYANEDTQRNAALTGEHKDYVTLVLILLRDEYKQQKTDGATSFIVPDYIAKTLNEECPWETDS